VCPLEATPQPLGRAPPSRPPPPSIPPQPLCTLSDVRVSYGRCTINVPHTQTRRFYFGVPSCTGGVVLPQTQTVTCGTTCAAGEYLGWGRTATCEKCAAGSASIGGGVLVTDWSSVLTPSLDAKLQFSTRCVVLNYATHEVDPSKTCLPWSADDAVMQSGHNENVDNSVSTLVVTFQTVALNSSLFFGVRVDGESGYVSGRVRECERSEPELTVSLGRPQRPSRLSPRHAHSALARRAAHSNPARR
jgi:hypothetical protein